ncbi:hypothetical protein VTN96DRAFT_10317 [Rasamsonia emersonii]
MYYVNRGSTLAVSILFIVLSITAVAARFKVRLQKRHNLKIDDWLCLPALVSSIHLKEKHLTHNQQLLVLGINITWIIGHATGTLGSQSRPMQPAEMTTYDGWDQQLFWRLKIAMSGLHMLALTTIKLFIIFFYHRIFFVSRSFIIIS